jgi:hypothetical protein
MVRTGMCEAPDAGAVRAMTERFSTELGGRLTLPLAFAAPNALCRVGETPTLLVTRAPRKEASSMWAAPRLTAWPPLKPLRDVAVTA